MITALKNAYMGELYGIAFFRYFIDNRKDGDKQGTWQRLLDIELLTAQRLRQGLELLGEQVPETDEAMTSKGMSDAEKWANLPWPQLIDTMVDWVAPYQQRYQANTDAATEYLDLFTLVSDHENAIYDFLLAEKNGAANPGAILDGFLALYSGTA
ncbi:hypothetical protein AL542_15235 [Grimontia hollisae]|nr:hypothetical protein [Grimontia hollisae]AMG31556.1 hypothetical protein AL542_15235 [Grimontia hollisae]MDF2185926.1 hypothetical protein [Grimontia hollisae]STO45358.1 Uncharacterised protein [Grimontia hollisae]STO57856.1 Uncharacterised protein [Grimontia hollisae]STQ76367.1 Uncharacterised protein [Grimontia hollisae]